MTNRNNDDIANALHGLASGEHTAGDSVAGGDAHAAPSPAPIAPQRPRPAPAPTPARPSSAAPELPRPPAPTPAQAQTQPALPKPPGSTRPARPVLPGATPPPQRAAVPGARAPTRPAAPGAGAAAPVTPAPPPTAPPAALRTSAPPAVPISVPASAAAFPPAQTGFVQDDQANRYDEDDAMNMPAPSAEYLAHVTHPVVHPKRAPIGRSAGFRNTLIPVLLTTAVLMLTAAVMKFVVHPDAPLAAMPAWLAVVLAAGGLAFAAVAVLYVIQGRSSPSTGAGVGTGGGRA